MKGHKKFAVFDIDGTLIRWQLYHAVVGELAKRGSLDVTTYEEIRKARMQWKKRTHDDSFKEYEGLLVAAYDTLLPSLNIQEFEAAVDVAFAEHKDQVYTYTRGLIHQLKKDGYVLFAISNSHQEIVSKVADYYGFDDCKGTVYPREGRHFTGQKQGFFATKHLALQTLIDKHCTNLEQSVAVGDSESDIPMLEMVAQPIAFNPTKKLLAVAMDKGWKVVVERKNVVYELESKNGQYLLA